MQGAGGTWIPYIGLGGGGGPPGVRIFFCDLFRERLLRQPEMLQTSYQSSIR
jgi:hypothetical protein